MDEQTDKFRKLIRDGLAEPGAGVFAFVARTYDAGRDKGRHDEILEAANLEREGTDDPVKRAMLRLLTARVYDSISDNERAREAAQAVVDEEGLPVEFRAYGLNIIGSAYLNEMETTAGESYFKQALGLLGDEKSEFSIYLFHQLGRAFLEQTRYYLALEYLQAHYDAVEEQGLEHLRSKAINSLAITFSFLGRNAEAEKCLFEAYELAKARGEKEQEGVALANLANHFSQMEEYETAEKYGREALNLMEEAGSPLQACASMINLASVYNSMERRDEALELAKKCLEVAEGRNMKEVIPTAYIMLGDLLNKKGDPEALFMLSKSVKLYETQFPGIEPQNIEYAFFKYGKMLLERGDQRGGEYVWKSLEVFKKRPSSISTRKYIVEAESIIRDLPPGADYFEKEQVEISGENLKRLLDISKAIGSESNLSGALEKVLEFALEISGAERGIIWTFEGGNLKPASSRNFSKELRKEPGYGVIVEISYRVASSGIEIDASNPEEIKATMLELTSSERMPVKSALALPLSTHGRTTGVIYLDSRFAFLSIPTALKQLLASLLEQAVIILDKLKLFEEESRKRQRLQRKVKRQENELRRTMSIVEQQQEELGKRHGFGNIIGKSLKMRKVFEQTAQASKIDLPVLIYGESGTGKEMFARALHYSGPRSDRLFVPINCASFPESLLEAELFGYEAGAFTGAVNSKEGLFEVADGGTLLLDEIGDMSEKMQAKLLRVIQENEVRRIGGRKTIKIDVRIVAASNRKIPELVSEGAFREDLFYRLNVVNIELPPLRERKGDIPILVEHFWRKAGGDLEETPADRKHEFLRTLEFYTWPGNVRELENEIEKMVALGDGTMNADLLSDHVVSGTEDVPFQVNSADGPGYNLQSMEARLMKAALEKARGNKAKAARLMGIPKSSFYLKAKKYGIEVE